MKPITPKTLDWIDDAPVVVTCTRTIAAPPERVWEAISDHEGWPTWFDVLTRVERMGSGEGVGGQRRVHIRGVAIEEEFLAWDPQARFAFTVTGTNMPGVRAIVEDVQLTPVGDAATTVSYTQALEPAGAKVVAPMLRRALPKALDKGLAGLARILER